MRAGYHRDGKGALSSYVHGVYMNKAYILGGVENVVVWRRGEELGGKEVDGGRYGDEFRV